MNWNEYIQYAADALSSETPFAPYDDPDYLEYAKMNEARMKRWLKTNPLTENTIAAVKSLQKAQRWIVITEPWCGDAAHITPILYMMSELNLKVHFEIQLRDTDSEIDNYLTNGTKSIPVIIVRDDEGKDVFIWGPRPAAAQELYLDLKAKDTPMEDIKIALQNFYNKDKAISIQEEFVDLLKKHF